MTLSYFIAVLHVATLAIGFAGVYARSRALKSLESQDQLVSVFSADNLYGLAALLWVGTGSWRAFGGLEKGTDYYLHSNAFLIKMALFGLVFILELYPMITLIKWRIAMKRGESIDLTPKTLMYRLCNLQMLLIFSIVGMAVAMSRGMWY